MTTSLSIAEILLFAVRQRLRNFCINKNKMVT